MRRKKSLFYISDPLGVKLLTRLHLQFSHLNEPRSGHGFSDTINPVCASGNELETTEQLLLCCHFYSTQRLELLKILRKLTQIF